MDLVAGGLCVLAASFLGGVTGFGYSLVATPLLLLLGFPLPFVVTVNLALAFVTRIAVAYRFRSYLNRRRVAGLIAGSVPGLWLGVEVLKAVPEATIKLCAGVIVMAAALLLWRAESAPPPRQVPGAPFAAGLAGGFLARRHRSTGSRRYCCWPATARRRAASWPIWRSTSSCRTRSAC